MTAPTYTCWLCGNLGALRKVEVIPDRVVFVPFRFDPAEGIDLARGEHVCPACHGSHNPRRTEFPIRLGGGAT